MTHARRVERESIMQNMKGRVAVITGAGSGIGRGLAIACGAEEMHLVLADIQADALAEEIGRASCRERVYSSV